MAETAAHLVDCVIAPVPVRQWVLSLPIPLRLLLAAQPQLLAPLLQVIHRVIAAFLIKQAGFKLSRADTGAVGFSSSRKEIDISPGPAIEKGGLNLLYV